MLDTPPTRLIILYAGIDTRACVEPKQFHDVVSSYNRFDVFHLTVDRTRQRPAVFRDAPPEPVARNGEDETKGEAS